MRTYAELVKEAIREAHEKSENEYKKFEVGWTGCIKNILKFVLLLVNMVPAQVYIINKIR